MNYILFDGPFRDNLLPFTYTRPLADVEWGIGSIRDSWERGLGCATSSITEDYLSEKYPAVFFEQNTFIHAAYLPTPELLEAVSKLTEGEAIFNGDDIVAFSGSEEMEATNFEQFKRMELDAPFLFIRQTWDLFSKNAAAIALDFDLITADRKSEPIPASVQTQGGYPIFIEPGAQLHFCSLNATEGPIYIGKNAQIMEGSLVRGPFALGAFSMLKMGAKIYGATSVGAYSKVGGELNNSIVFSYSNKGHEGFLGNSVIGSWCNIGADTNTSNMKNSYEKVRLWDYSQERFVHTGLQFCGLMMGDHSKCGINTMFNTGTVVGVSANVFGAGFVKNFVPSFSWGGIQNSQTFTFEKAMQTAEAAMARKQEILEEEDREILMEVFKCTAKWRKN
ncbi:GlmU family protein [Flavobacteriaceae bacterium LSUCC0859]|jgi:UDP-N-acetylglucosamine diphosphorylase/glucosamine-1-phosphate N-acetyltransferase|nr:GlmU family protein [Flavobacteriaceae bacterium LSUCC0859]